MEINEWLIFEVNWMKWNRDWIACLVWFSRKSVLAQWIPAIKLQQAAIPIRFQSFSKRKQKLISNIAALIINLIKSDFHAFVECKEKKIKLISAAMRN